ncbi:tetratricopeptide repeat protein [Nonomuraea sp. NBC_01738]|uniref:AfsR/SARP family transcriptional regulator n=1 Tax=Nonomuraea sp. NBC_01738 TaxID=2976003 RepID=UPI002E13E0B9|nr:tetratricopeptide repeat protein [Nonomuraea sp. NBC_01738]
MRFKILGPLVVEHEGRELALGGSLQRVVMATLLLDANRVVPLERMIEAAWGQTPPGTARNQVQIRVSQLRRVLDDTAQPYQVLITRPPGYLIKVAPGELDLGEFDELVARARAEEPAQAVRTLRAALALWRGPALSDVDSDLISPVVHDLEERRLLAHEQCVELELGLGHHLQLVGELRRLAQDHPLRERLHSHLMLALYRSGRQAEALDAFRAYREMLLDTLGLEPSDELRRLELAILNQEPDLDLATPPARQTPVPRQLPPVISRLSGRAGEMRRIASILNGKGACGPLPVAAVVGRAGVGKTELALQAAHDLSTAYPDGQLYVDLRGGAVEPTDVLSMFLRALGVTAIPRSPEERGALFRSTVSGHRLLMVLDNAGSFDQVWPLLPGGAPCGVLVTSRERPIGLAEHWVVRLGVLDDDSAVELLTSDVGQWRAEAEPAALRTLAEQCGGLPLALRIAGARLAVRPQWSVETLVGMLGDSRTMLDVLSHGDLEVRASLDVSYRGLSERARQLFRRIGLIASPLTTGWLGESLLDGEADGAFEELVDASLLTRRGARYSIHDLVRAFAGERAAAEESQEQQVAALERACATFLKLSERAHERYYGGHFTLLRGKGGEGPFAPTLADALIGDDALAWFDEERVTLQALVRQAAAHGLDELCWNIAMTAITLFETHGYFDEWRAVSEVALEACRAAGNTRGEGAMVYSLSSLAVFQQRYVEAHPMLTEALGLFEEIGEVHGRALALRNMAMVERMRGDCAAALERYQQALPLLRAVGDRAAEAHALVNLAGIHLERNRLDDAEPLLDQALSIFRAEGVQRGEAQALNSIGRLSLRQGKAERALEAFEAANGIVREVRDRIGEAYVLQGMAEARVALGQCEQAKGTLAAALAIAERLGERLIAGRIRLNLGLLMMEGERTTAAAHLEEAYSLFDEIGAEPWRARAAEALARAR